MPQVRNSVPRSMRWHTVLLQHSSVATALCHYIWQQALCKAWVQ